MAETPYRLMFVDDSKTFLKIAERLCSGLAVQAIFASELDMAFAALERMPLDIVFVDYEMPEMTGLDLLLRIRKTQPDVKVVIVTGTLDPDAFDATMAHHQLGADGFIEKPFGEAELKSCLETILERGGRYMSTS